MAILLILSLFLSASSLPLEALDAPNPTPFFSFDRFGRNRGAEIVLYGDAEISDSIVRMTRGRITYRKPIRFFGTQPGFSTNFSFSGGGLAFSLIPKSGSLESGLLISVRYGANFIKLDLGGEISVRSHGLSWKDGEKMHSWIDYSGELKILEVRISRFWDRRPINSSISYPIDLSSVLWRETMFVGMSSSSGNSTQATNLHSWDFVLKHGAPYRMHSDPLNPQSFLVKPEGPSVHLARVYPWRILVALVFGAACGILVAFAVLFVVSAMFQRRPVAPMEYSEPPMEFGDEKVVLVGEKGAKAST